MDVCIYDHDEIALVDLDINLPPHYLQDLTCLRLVLIHLKFIMRLVESTCTILLLPNLDRLLCKKNAALSDINVRLEAIICEE